MAAGRQGAQLHKLIEELGFYLEALAMGWPGYSGNRLRMAYLRRKLTAKGRFFIERGCTVLGPESITLGEAFRCGKGALLAAHGGGRLEIGDRVSLNTNVHLNASGGIRIVLGNDVMVGPNVVMRSADHGFERTDIPIRLQPHTAREIIVEDDVWIGANVVIVGGVRIGCSSVIGAGAVVTRDVPPYSVAMGVPARVVAKRGSESHPQLES